MGRCGGKQRNTLNELTDRGKIHSPGRVGIREFEGT